MHLRPIRLSHLKEKEIYGLSFFCAILLIMLAHVYLPLKSAGYITPISKHDADTTRQKDTSLVVSNLNWTPTTTVQKPLYFTADEIKNATRARKEWSEHLYLNPMDARHSDTAAASGHRKFDFLGPVVPECTQIESFGMGDDEKRACKLNELVRASPPDYGCTIISLGSNNQWGFEEAVFSKLTSCQIHTFDCTVPVGSKPPTHILSRTTLHRICIGNQASEMNGTQPLFFRTWKTIMNTLHETKAPLYLKMDIEGYEYGVLKSIIEDSLLMPMQIAVELHHHECPPVPNGKGAIELALFMEYLYTKGGYFLIDRKDNPLCASCSEILLSRASMPWI
jgi:hypothetical protein